ncbi:MAG: DUF4157 domain-containing protein [Lentisphaeraceae bacterium]|nr:DUF4157 domain-containing protein [Lentisphaeraceae bacterium]
MYTRGKQPTTNSYSQGTSSTQAKVQRKSKSPLASKIQAHLENSGQTASIQRKVKIGQANDHYEKEADKVADQVVSSPESSMIKPVQSKVDSISTLQRSEEEEAQTKIQREEEEEAAQPKGEEEEESMQAKGEEEEAQTKVQRAEEEEAQAKFDKESLQSSDFEERLQASKSSGEVLQGEIKGELESKIGADFSSIKIHTGPVADGLSKDIGALAFAVGNHVYFKDGQFDPNSKEGKHLLAHELTHTVQQGAANKVESSDTKTGGSGGRKSIIEEEEFEESETELND